MRDDLWPAARIEKLKKLLADGLSYRAIAEQMGVSKNAVCGKVVRLGLCGRPLPIKRTGAVSEKRAKQEERARILAELFPHPRNLYGVIQPLPAGDTNSWALINRGLASLEGVEFRR